MVLLQALSDSTVVAEPTFSLFEKLSPKFFLRLGINIVSMIILVRFIYFRAHKSKEYFFTFFIFNLLIFLITFLLNKVDMSMGAAFGLFAVFSMLRYRTEGITIKDMTYLFLVIAIGLINAVSKGSWDEFTAINGIILLFTYLLESNLLMKRESAKIIEYDNIELIKPEKRAELITDLEGRTGIKINRISINEINFLKDTAIILVNLFYTNIGIGYKYSNFLKVEVVYRSVEKHLITDFYSIRHRMMVDITFKKKFKEISLSYRQRFQAEVRNVHSSNDGGVPEWYT